jgi:predicted nucleotidyltransferase component of viral defense system
LRVLIEILDDSLLAHSLYFKGGTCASMVGMLDRFSVDLDFDLDIKENKEKNLLRVRFHEIFDRLGLEVKDESEKALEFFVRYPSRIRDRNTIKIDALDFAFKANRYATYYLSEIDRIAICQSKETMFANKLVAPLDRYKKHNAIAGRDIYDIHHFFLNGYKYNENVIMERTGKSIPEFLRDLEKFVDRKITDSVLDEDLNMLLPPEIFMRIRKILKQETLMLIRQEMKRISA